MPRLSYDRYCDEVSHQTALLRELLPGDKLDAPVPTCPGWTLADLVRHIGGNLHTVGASIRRDPAVDTSGAPPGEVAAGVTAPDGDDPAVLEGWLGGAAEAFAQALREAGPQAQTEVWGMPESNAFWARRAGHDILVHRADAAVTTGEGFTVAPDLAADAVDELLELVTDPRTGAAFRRLPELFGPPRTLHLHATDTVEGLVAEWLVELGPDGVTWRHGHEKATVALQAPLTELLLILYRRLPVDRDQVHVHGDRALLDDWLERVSMG